MKHKSLTHTYKQTVRIQKIESLTGQDGSMWPESLTCALGLFSYLRRLDEHELLDMKNTKEGSRELDDIILAVSVVRIARLD
jgi:hypothetical protein